MKHILTYLILLLCSSTLLAQSGVRYVNYKSYKTHYGNGSNSTLNGVTYSGIADNITELEAMLDVNQPGTTLTHQGETFVNSSYGFIGGKPPRWANDYYAVHHWGWFQPQETGTYRFSLNSDDASALWIDNELKLFRPCCGTSYVDVSLVAGQWYRLDTKWQEYTGGDSMTLLYSPPSSTSFFNVGASTHLIFSNIEPIPVHKLDVTYNLKSILDKTKFSSSVVYTDLGTASTLKSLSSNGVVTFQEGDGLDNTLYSTGNKRTTTTGGQVEWCVLYSYNTFAKNYRIGIDKREFPAGFDFTKLTNIQLFDLYDGTMQYYRDDDAWAEYLIYTDTQFDFVNSTFSPNIRSGNGYHALQAEFSFEDIIGFTSHKVKLDMDETYFTATYPDMITIADVAKGFSQLTNQTDTPDGLGGGVFTSDVEFMLGDVNNDSSFNFRDTQLMLEHIAGQTSPFENYTVGNSLLVFDGGYTNSTTSNWSSNKPTTRLFTHTLDDNTLEQTKSIDVAFIGDLDFSHSSTLQSVNVTAKSSPQIMFSKSGTDNVMILDVIKEGDILKVTLDIPQNQNNISGTQFKLNYDESRLEYVDSEFSTQSISSFTSKRSGYINIGSFSSDGSSTINGGITYTLNFKLKSPLDSTLGLISVGFSELVNKDGGKIIYTVQ